MQNCPPRSYAKTSPRSSPILQLPYDVLRLIFIFAYNSRRKEDRTRLAVTVSLVCRPWRLSAIGTSYIWARIVFNRHPPFEPQSIQLERSRGALLNIKICRNYNIKQTAQIIKLLRPHVARWSSLVIKLREPKAKSYRLFFDEFRHAAAPCLSTLEVENYSTPTHGWTFQPFSGGTQSLTKLSVSSCRIKGNTSLFSGLTELIITEQNPWATHYSSLTTYDIFAIISQAASTLIVVSIQDPRCQPLGMPDVPSPPITLPHLVNITLPRAQGPSHLVPIWVQEVYAGIVAPEVRQNDLDIATLEHLVPYSTFPFPNLSSLTIRDGSCWGDRPVTIQQSTFIWALSGLPQLRGLTIVQVASFDHTILASLCDKLESLMIYGSDWPIQPSGMKDMVEARHLRARMKGLTDSLQCVHLEMFELPPSEVIWLESHLRDFTCWTYSDYVD